MLRIDSVRSFLRSLIVREVRVEVPVPVPVEVERVVEKPVEVTRTYWILHRSKPTVLQHGTVVGATEFACLNRITCFAGERVQFELGGRYRVHPNDNNAGRVIFTRIDPVSRAHAGSRAFARDKTRNAAGTIVGE